jgi:hypothetical protein
MKTYTLKELQQLAEEWMKIQNKIKKMVRCYPKLDSGKEIEFFLTFVEQYQPKPTRNEYSSGEHY